MKSAAVRHRRAQTFNKSFILEEEGKRGEEEGRGRGYK
jgi:hypothetical protein